MKKTCLICNKLQNIASFCRKTFINNTNKVICRDCVYKYAVIDKPKLANNKHKRNNHYKHYKKKLAKATPKWLSKSDLKLMKDIYIFCRWLNNWKIEGYQVDHIIPINGDIVSGLHIPANLRIIRAIDNMKKSNKYYE